MSRYERIVPNVDHELLPLTIIFKLGWLPYLLLLLVLAALLAWLLFRCLRQKSQLGRMVALAVVLTLGLQTVSSVVLNLGFVLFSAELPLLVGNLHTVLDMGLIGLALSVFRGDAVARENRIEGTGRGFIPVGIHCKRWQNSQKDEKIFSVSLILKRR